MQLRLVETDPTIPVYSLCAKSDLAVIRVGEPIWEYPCVHMVKKNKQTNNGIGMLSDIVMLAVPANACLQWL